MGDKTIVGGQTNLGKGGDSVFNMGESDYGYLDNLIREVCLKGDSLDKYGLVLKKRYPSVACYELCREFVQIYSHLKELGKPSFSEVQRLQKLGTALHLSEDTMNEIYHALDESHVESDHKASKDGELGGGSDVTLSSLKTMKAFVVFFYIGSLFFLLIRNLFPEAYFMSWEEFFQYCYVADASVWVFPGLCLFAFIDFLIKWWSFRKGNHMVSFSSDLFYSVIIVALVAFIWPVHLHPSDYFQYFWQLSLCALGSFFAASVLRIIMQRKNTKHKAEGIQSK